MDQPHKWKPLTFVTGGQSGADSIPFTVYKALEIGITGWMPKDFRREGGDGKEIAELHGLKEGEGGYAWRDKKNVATADALIGFLVDRPLTGKGTMQTANMCKTDFLIIRGNKPILIFWDMAEDKLERFSTTLRGFLEQYKPKNLMVAGSCESTVPGIESLGAQLMTKTFKDRFKVQRKR